MIYPESFFIILIYCIWSILKAIICLLFDGYIIRMKPVENIIYASVLLVSQKFTISQLSMLIIISLTMFLWRFFSIYNNCIWNRESNHHRRKAGGLANSEEFLGQGPHSETKSTNTSLMNRISNLILSVNFNNFKSLEGWVTLKANSMPKTINIREWCLETFDPWQ